MLEQQRYLPEEVYDILKHGRDVPVSGLLSKTWYRCLDIAFAHFDPAVPTGEIVSEYGISRQRVGQVALRTLRTVYDHVRDQNIESGLRPLEDYLKIRSNEQLFTFRVYPRRNFTISIADAIAQGADTVTLRELGFSVSQVKRYVVDPEPSGSKAFFEKLSNQPPDDKIEKMFKEAEREARLDAIVNYHRQKKPNLALLFTITDILKGLNRAILNRQIPKIAEALRRHGIVIFPSTKTLKNGKRLGTTWLTTAWHKGQIEELILNDPEIKALAPDSPVTQITGPKQGHISTFQILGRKEFKSVSSICQELGYPNNTWINNLPVELLNEAKEPIFSVRRKRRRGKEGLSRYVPVEYSVALRSYIEENLRRTGQI